MSDKRTNDVAEIIKQQRFSHHLTLAELSAMSGVSQSYLGRIENAERFPSASVLKKIAKPLGFREDEIFMLAGFLTPLPARLPDENKNYGHIKGLDPFVEHALAQEPIDVQRAAIIILAILKSLNKTEKSDNIG